MSGTTAGRILDFHAPSEGDAEGEPRRDRLNRFEVDVINWCRFARQLRGVEIVDLVGSGVIKQVENVEPQSRLLGNLVADPQIDERRWFRGNAVVLN